MPKPRTIKQDTQAKRYVQPVRHLVLCEGKTEQWYLAQQLDSRKYKVEQSKHSNALNLVKLDAIKRINIADWDKIYCVFDRDSGSNTKEQMQKLNGIFKEFSRELEHIFSNPCFEVALLFNFLPTTLEFANYDEVESKLNRRLPDGKQYSKTPDGIKLICQLTEFNVICKNAEKIYDSLGVNDDNWFEITDGFSEIFKFLIHSIACAGTI